MKNLKNLLYMLLVLAVGGFATSCSEDEADNAAYSEGFGVYFSTEMDTEFLLEEGQTVVQVPVLRSKAAADAAYSISVIATPSEAADGLLNIPYTADFAAGEYKTTLDITFNFNNIKPGEEYLVNLQLYSEEKNVSDYGLSSVDLVIKFDPWTQLEGDAHFRDGAVCDLYKEAFGLGVEAGAQSACKIERSDLNPNLYRLVEPYNAELMVQMLAPFGMSIGEMIYFITEQEEYFYFEIYEDNRVYIDASDTGIDLGLGEGEGVPYVFTYTPENFAEFPADEEPGYGTYDPATMTITFPKENAVATGCDLGWLFSNTTGMMRIVLPGGLWMNPTAQATLDHLKLDSEMVRSASFKVTLNDDCGSYLAALAEGNITKDVAALNEFAAGMIDGSNASKLYTEAGEITLEYPRGGAYTLVLQPIGKDNQTYGAPFAVAFEDLSSEVSPLDFKAEVTLSDLNYSTVSFNVTPNTNKISYYFDYMPTDLFEESLAAAENSMEVMLKNYFVEYIEYLNLSSGYFYQLEEVLPLISSLGPDTYSFRRLEPNTDYTYFVFPVDLKTGDARGEILVDNFTTKSYENASAGYKQWLGSWEVSSVETFHLNNGVFSGTPTSFVIDLSVDDADAGTYYMDGWDKESTGYGVPVYWNEAAGQLEFRNNLYMGYDEYNAAHRDFFGYFTYELEIPGENGAESQTVRGVELKYDFENFKASTDHEVMMVGKVAADGTATVTGQMIKGKILAADNETVLEIDAKVAGMNVFALTDEGGFYGVFATFNLSIGDYMLKPYVPTTPQRFTVASKMPERMQQLFEKQYNETPKMVRLNEAARNNYVMAR